MADHTAQREALGARVAELRRATGLSAQGLAFRTRSIPPARLAEIESGRDAGLSFDDICSLADALGVPCSELVRRPDRRPM